MQTVGPGVLTRFVGSQRKKAAASSKQAAQKWAECRERLLVHGKPKRAKEDVQKVPTLKEFALRFSRRIRLARFEREARTLAVGPMETIVSFAPSCRSARTRRTASPDLFHSMKPFLAFRRRRTPPTVRPGRRTGWMRPRFRGLAWDRVDRDSARTAADLCRNLRRRRDG
jgi:hypothetical protein